MVFGKHSYHFLEIIVTPNMNAVEKDLRDSATSSQLLHPGSQLWMFPQVHLTYWDTQTPQGGLGMHTVRAALDSVHSYSAQRTALHFFHLQIRQLGSVIITCV